MFPLLFITDSNATVSLFKTVTEAIAGGARLIQYRDKINSRRVIYENARRLRVLTAERGVTLIINDHLDIACAVGAEGVHLGQTDLPLGAARRIWRGLIGISTHTLAEAMQAEQEGADYIGFGPIFSTSSKADAQMPVGLEPITPIKKVVCIPLYAIGGITLSRLPDVLDAGADGVAAISAFTGKGDVRAHVAQWLKAMSLPKASVSNEEQR